MEPDIINLHGLGDGLIGIRIKQVQKPVLLTIHGEDKTKYAQMFSKMLSKYTLSNVDAINSQSNFLKILLKIRYRDKNLSDTYMVI